MNDERIYQITVVSGKGGTGKTSIIAALAYLFKDFTVLADADVDAADLYLIFEPQESKSTDFYGLKKAVIDQEKCSRCNLCRDSCRFSAIDDDLIVDDLQCEGCGLCYHICPEKAITMKENLSGKYYVSKTRIGKLVHANLTPGEENSGLLVAEVRKAALEVAKEERKRLILIDGSPGLGCPVISSLTGTDLAIIVTEPTCSAKHDLERLLELLDQFRIQGIVVVNKSDINENISKEIEELCKDRAPVIAKIPYNHAFTKAMIEKQSLPEYQTSNESVNNLKNELVKISEAILNKIGIN